MSFPSNAQLDETLWSMIRSFQFKKTDFCLVFGSCDFIEWIRNIFLTPTFFHNVSAGIMIYSTYESKT